MRIDTSLLIPFNLRDFLHDPEGPAQAQAPYCNNASSCRVGRFGASRLPEPVRLQPRNTMDGSSVAQPLVQCLHYDHPRGLAHVTILILSQGFVSPEEDEERE